MTSFYEWFDAAPLWQVGLVTLGVTLLLTALMCAWVWWASGRRM